MRLARWIFGAAGVWGVVVLTPMFFAEKYVDEKYPPAVTHPEFYYGFVCVALAAQFMFLVIARDPIRYRLLMLVGMWEKFSATIAAVVLGFMGRVSSMVVSAAMLDFLWGLLFVVAWMKTRDVSATDEKIST